MSNQQLIHEERSTIASLKSKSCSCGEIAAITDRHRTTVWSQLKRNSNSSETYTAPEAGKAATEHALRVNAAIVTALHPHRERYR